ncbi:MAG: ABC transporter permease, partial [Actinomycetota bacterium]
MGAFVVRRVLLLVPILLGVTLIAFAIVHLTPGDPIRLALGAQATPESIISLRHARGLDDPIVVQYLRYVGNALHGDLGTSIRGQTSVAADLARRLPSTLELAGCALAVAALIGVLVGAAAASTKRRWWDGVLMTTVIAGMSIPVFWVAMVGLLVFSVH